MKEVVLQIPLKRFLKYDIREVSIKKLIDPLRISTKTVYKYLKNKQTLLEEELCLFYAQQCRLLKDLTVNKNPVCLLSDMWCAAIQRTHKTNAVFFKSLQSYYFKLEKKIERTIAKNFTKQFIRFIEKVIKTGFFHANIIPAVATECKYIFHTANIKNGQFKKYKPIPYNLLLNTIILYKRSWRTSACIMEQGEYVQKLQPATDDKFARLMSSLNQS